MLVASRARLGAGRITRSLPAQPSDRAKDPSDGRRKVRSISRAPFGWPREVFRMTTAVPGAPTDGPLGRQTKVREAEVNEDEHPGFDFSESVEAGVPDGPCARSAAWPHLRPGWLRHHPLYLQPGQALRSARQGADWPAGTDPAPATSGLRELRQCVPDEKPEAQVLQRPLPDGSVRAPQARGEAGCAAPAGANGGAGCAPRAAARRRGRVAPLPHGGDRVGLLRQ